MAVCFTETTAPADPGVSIETALGEVLWQQKMTLTTATGTDATYTTSFALPQSRKTNWLITSAQLDASNTATFNLQTSPDDSTFTNTVELAATVGGGAAVSESTQVDTSTYPSEFYRIGVTPSAALDADVVITITCTAEKPYLRR